MKFQPDLIGAATVSAYGPGWIAVAGERISHSLILHATGEKADWKCTSFEQLTPEHFAVLAHEASLAEGNSHRTRAAPELVVFGSGNRLRFPRPQWLRPLIEAGIGVETMDTAAACRTYNILAGEGRRVVAALLVEPAKPDAD